MSWKPREDWIFVTRLEGHGVESVSAGGIIIPATVEASIRTKADNYRARVEAMGPEAERAYAGDLKPGDTVIVHAYAAEGRGTFTGQDVLGKAARNALWIPIKPDDIVCAVEA